jgi:outer membrane protein OmpA-like peptidoglycan-associated protein
MMVKKKFYTLVSYFIAGCVMGIPSFATAGDPVFQNTRDEMVKELTRQPVKYRSFGTDEKKRSIVVLEKKSNSINVVSNSSANLVTGNSSGLIDSQYEEKTIVVVDNQDVPGLKLKIEFDYNSSALRSSCFSLLRELGLALTSSELSTSYMMVAGHTDSDGTDKYNLRLSFERANSVKKYLIVNFNIPESRLKIRGYGESMPLKPNTDSFSKQMNRRVEIQATQ